MQGAPPTFHANFLDMSRPYMIETILVALRSCQAVSGRCCRQRLSMQPVMPCCLQTSMWRAFDQTPGRPTFACMQAAWMVATTSCCCSQTGRQVCWQPPLSRAPISWVAPRNCPAPSPARLQWPGPCAHLPPLCVCPSLGISRLCSYRQTIHCCAGPPPSGTAGSAGCAPALLARQSS